MKKLLFLPALLLGTVGVLRGQVALELVLEQEQFLRDESLTVKVRIINRSGQTLHLGRGKDWLVFEVQNLQGAEVHKLGEAPVEGEFDLETAEAAARTVDLMPYFDFSQPGRYQVMATVRIQQWGTEVTSLPKIIEIGRGAKIWEQDFGVPGSGEPPVARKYALVQAMYLKRLQVYLRLTDLSENQVFGVRLLGPVVSFARPEAQLDRENRLHVIFQTGARTFFYYVIQPDGVVVLRQTYDYTETRPRLKPGDDGAVKVTGGVRRVDKTDLPPPAELSVTNALTNLSALLTNTAPATNSGAKGGQKKGDAPRK